MSDQAYNIEFVRIIRKYPCIYDNTKPEHCMRNVIDAAWNSVSKEIRDNVHNCKERWKNIRTVFRRNVISKKGGLSKRPYYLNDEMQFMVPFLQARGRCIMSLKTDCVDVSSQDDPDESTSNNVSEDYEGSIETESTEDPLAVVEAVIKHHPVQYEDRLFNMKKEDVSDEEDDESKPQSSVFKNVFRSPQIIAPKIFKEIPYSTSRNVERDWDQYEMPTRKKLRTDCTCYSDPDQQFLLSLKPDLVQMNMEQKRRFKKGIFDLLADIMDNDAAEACNEPSPSFR